MSMTDIAIRAFDSQDKVYKRADDRCLYLEVHPNGSKLWRYKYRHQGKANWDAGWEPARATPGPRASAPRR